MKEQTFPANIDKMYEVLDFVKASILGIEEIIAPLKLELVVEEIFVNIAHYAYKENVGSVTIQCGQEDDMTIIRFIDGGIPFDMTSRPDPDITSSAKDRLIGGLGIYLVKETMDYVNYEYKENNNVLTLGVNSSKKNDILESN